MALGPEEKQNKVVEMGPAAKGGWRLQRTKLAGSFESLAGEPTHWITAQLTDVRSLCRDRTIDVMSRRDQSFEKDWT